MRPNLLILAAAMLIGATAACGKKPIEVASERPQFVQTGVASWYGSGFEGGKTASGERFDPNDMTAAHRTLPFGTMVRVTNLRNNRSIDVRIINRGPFIKGRIIDLSPSAAKQLRIGKSGIVRVRIEASPARKKRMRRVIEIARLLRKACRVRPGLSAHPKKRRRFLALIRF